MIPLAPEGRYQQLGAHIASAPDLLADADHLETMRWLGQAHALVDQIDRYEAMGLKSSMGFLSTTITAEKAARDIMHCLHRVLAKAELAAPAASAGAFITVGNPFDAFATLAKVFSAALTGVFVVDPYLDEHMLTDFAPTATEGVKVRLLTDRQGMRPSLTPAALRWSEQYGTKRPLEVRVAVPRSLHDRIIFVDGAETWLWTQSFKDLAVRSPATLARVDADTAQLKVSAYEDLWSTGIPLNLSC